MHEETMFKISSAASQMRRHAIQMGYAAGAVGAHFGPGLSIIEITATLYCGIMKRNPENPLDDERDRFILSKGHGSLGYYTALAAAGYLTKEELYTFEENDGILPGQPQMNLLKGIEYASGSLGHGLSVGIGMAIAAKRRKKDYKVYVLMGDGECNEGTVWEAAMSASHHRLDNLIAIIDRNNMQSDGSCTNILEMGQLSEKWTSFGWNTIQVDGHNIPELYFALSQPTVPGRPSLIIAHTVKGKGISFMENNGDWHHNRLSKDQFETAMRELNENVNSGVMLK